MSFKGENLEGENILRLNKFLNIDAKKNFKLKKQRPKLVLNKIKTNRSLLYFVANKRL